MCSEIAHPGGASHGGTFNGTYRCCGPENKACAKPLKKADERGLYLLVTPSGRKLWRYKYRHGGKEKLLALGAYPDVSLADARDGRDAARKFPLILL